MRQRPASAGMSNRRAHMAFTSFCRPGGAATSLITVLLLTTACSNSTERIKLLTTRLTTQQDTATGVTAIYSEYGRVKAQLFTKRAIQNDGAKPPYIDMLGGLTVIFYDSTGAEQSTLTAKYARYYEQQGNILVRDSVLVNSKKGNQLRTSELVWNQNIQRIFTEKPVQITTPTQVLYGTGMEANQDFTWYQISNLTGTVQVSNSEIPK
jgi:LPS export ABC transporter protein LptC